MNTEQKTKCRAYAKIKLDIKVLVAEAKALNPEILQAVLEEKEKTGKEGVVVGDLGEIAIEVRRNWKFSPEIEAIKTQYEAACEKAKQTGIGSSYTELQYPVFTGNKE